VQFFDLVGVVVEPYEPPVVRLDQQPYESSPPASLVELLPLLYASVELSEPSPASAPHICKLPQLSSVVVAPPQQDRVSVD
jgi:hypothetical protein